MALMNWKSNNSSNYRCMISNLDRIAAKMTFSVTLILNGNDPTSNRIKKIYPSSESRQNRALIPQ